MSGLVHPDQNVRNATQNSSCRAVNRRRGCCACSASNRRRRARFSRTRSSLERKTLTNQPRKCRSDTIIAGIISENSESSFAPSHSFCRCTTFWRGTTPKTESLQVKLQVKILWRTKVPSITHRICLLLLDYTVWLAPVLRRDANHEEQEEGQGGQEGEETSSAEASTDEVQSGTRSYRGRHAPVRTGRVANQGPVR